MAKGDLAGGGMHYTPPTLTINPPAKPEEKKLEETKKEGSDAEGTVPDENSEKPSR